MASANPQHGGNHAGDAPADAPSTIVCRALHLGRAIDTRHIEESRVLAVRPLTVQVGAQGHAVLFRFGVAVLVNVSAIEEAEFRAAMSGFVDQPVETPGIEDLDIVVDEERPDTVTSAGIVSIKSITPAHLQVIADVLAKSLILEHYETRVTDVFDRLEPFADELRTKGYSRQDMRALMRQTGDVLMTQHLMVGRVEVVEKPEILWDNPGLEELHARLVREYELLERDRALERKFRLISDTAEALIGFVHNKHSLRVEWYIVILIMFEILIYLYDLFLR